MVKVQPLQSSDSKIKDLAEYTISGALYRVMQWSRWVGVAPLRIVMGSGAGEWRVQVSHTACVLSFLFIILLNLSNLASPLIDFNVGLPNIKRSQLRWLILLTNHLIMMIWTSNAVFGGPARTMQIIRSVHRVQKVKKTISDEYIAIHSRKDRKNFVIIGLSTLLSFLGFLVNYLQVISVKIQTGRITLFEDLYNNPIFMMMHIMVMMAKLQFTIGAMNVFYTFRSINDVFEYVEKNSTKKSVLLCVPGYKKSKPVDDVIRHLSSLYLETCDVVKELDSSCGLNILLLLTSCFLQLITQSYWLCQDVFIVMRSSSIMLSHLIWCLSQITWLVEVIEPCHRTKLEIERTNLIISNLSNAPTLRSMSGELEKLSQYLALNKVCYCPMGVCKLSRSIIATIIANVTTYLVIIIQFQSTDAET